MKKVIYFSFFLIVFLFQAHYSEKRPIQLSIEELTNPTSRNYVPFPFPKNREEVILDLKYFIDQECAEENGRALDGYMSEQERLMAELVKPNSEYRIAKIVKVKNRSAYYIDKYSWLIYVTNKQGNAVLRIAVMETGLIGMYGAVTDETIRNTPDNGGEKLKLFQRVLSDEEVKKRFSNCIGKQITEKDISKMDRIAYQSTIGGLLKPVWEIKMNGGLIYYYSENRDMFYQIDKKIPYKKLSRGCYAATPLTIVGHHDYLPETLYDQIVVLKKVEKQK